MRQRRTYRRRMGALIGALFIGPLLEFGWWVMCKTHSTTTPPRPSYAWRPTGGNV